MRIEDSSAEVSSNWLSYQLGSAQVITLMIVIMIMVIMVTIMIMIIIISVTIIIIIIILIIIIICSGSSICSDGRDRSTVVAIASRRYSVSSR